MAGRFSSLRIWNFRTYFIGQSLSMIGSFVQMFAQAWLVLKITDSANALGATVALQFLPMLILGTWGGVVADRFDNRVMLTTTSAISGVLALGLGLLVLRGDVTLLWVQGFALALGMVSSFERPAASAILFELTGPAEVSNAVAVNMSLTSVARLLGPAVAGALIAGVGIGWCFMVNAGSYLFAIGALLSLRRPELFERRPATREKGLLKAGLRYAWVTPAVRRPLAAMFVVGTLGYNFTTVMPALAKFTFHVDAGHLGWVQSASAAGSLIGGVMVAGIKQPTIRLLGLSSAAFGVGLLAFTSAPNYWLWLVFAVPVGISSTWFISGTQGLLQRDSDPAMLGRVMALFSIGFFGTTPFGAVLAGWLITHESARLPFVVGGVASVLCGAVLLGLRPAGVAAARAEAVVLS